MNGHFRLTPIVPSAEQEAQSCLMVELEQNFVPSHLRWGLCYQPRCVHTKPQSRQRYDH